jgi:ubiquinone/menaquinone biosynthesis C-methylase UbiE
MNSSTGSVQPDRSYDDFLKGIALRQENEYERLRLQHELHKTAMSGKLVQVPLSKTRSLRILDSGTGDGTWMVDVSKQYPKAEFVGTDLFPKHFEQLKDLPKVISFKVQSVLDDWPVEDHETYDLVHQRYCLAQFSAEKDAVIIKRLFGNVKPGGYLQIVDAKLDGFDRGEEHTGMMNAMDYFIKAFIEHGLEPRPGPSAAEWMRQAGAVDVHEEVMSFNVGIKAATPEDQTSTTINLTTIIDNFAAIGSRKSWPYDCSIIDEYLTLNRNLQLLVHTK